MRGLVKLPDLISAKTARSPEVQRGSAGAPKPAARSQTDQVGVAHFAMSLNRGRPARDAGHRGLVLPVQSDGQEEHLRQTFLGKGLFLVRQEQWDVLGESIREMDLSRETTSEGVGTAGLLSQGARGDLVQAARSAIAAGQRVDPQITEALDEALEDCPDCWGVAIVVAQAHMEIGMSALGTPPTSRPAIDDPVFRHHFDRAAEILDPLCALELDSALLAEARCDLLLSAADAPDRISDDYEDLIDLDPDNPRHMRRFGLRLLPRWYGSYERLDELAHQTAEQVADLWGEGGYVWVWLDVLRAVPEAAERLDIDRYLEGLSDILDRRGTQHVVNLIAAHAGVVMDPAGAPGDIGRKAVANRAAINARFGPILRSHLHELHPRHWAEARQSPFAPQPTPEALAEDGEAIARSLIARQFGDELASGRIVTFSPRGLEVDSPA